MGLNVKLDTEATERTLVRFIRDYVESAGARGVVLGLSGGLDSAVGATLAVRALGAERVHPFFLPAATSSEADRKDAKRMAEHLGLTLTEHPIDPMTDATHAALGKEPPRQVAQNILPRLRMVLLFAEAQDRGAIVMGTGNKSELLTGYFTKYGDGGVDLQPLGDLYKTQVQELAVHLGVPSKIVDKTPSAGLWEGQTDEDELGMTYDTLDQVLLGIEVDLPFERIAEDAGVPLDEVHRIERLRRATQHKRHMPIVPKLGIRTVGTDWRDPVMGDGPEA
ncbi:MAG: NAD+ synthase [Euryarchaeota archaeon]|nr:NAD+ synthase [Euryarchaeota archaeon]